MGVVSSAGIDRDLVGLWGLQSLLVGRTSSSTGATSSTRELMDGEGAILSGLGTLVEGRGSPRSSDSSGSDSGRDLREWRK